VKLLCAYNLALYFFQKNIVAKAASKMLVESTTGVDINNILQASFTNESVLRSLLVLNEKMCPTQSLIL
jgi:hypothetical protein